MYLTMPHWNGNQCCAIDTETTGLDPTYHEIIQICILPLTGNLLPREDVVPFYINMIPEHPKRVDPNAMRKNRLKLAEISLKGFDKFKAIDMLETWISKLKLPYNRGRFNQCKIIPLGHNYAFDMGFIKKWLGIEQYEEWFHYHYKDTMNTATFLNDSAVVHAEKPPFNKLTLNWVANRLNAPVERAHDALSDCVTVAECYRRLTQKGLF